MICRGGKQVVGFGSTDERLFADYEAISTPLTAAIFLAGQPAVGFSLGDLPEGSVAQLLAYYKMWTPYVAGVAHAMRAQGDAWAAMAAGQKPVAAPVAAASSNTDPVSSISQWQTLAQFCYSEADYLAQNWNAHAGSSDWDKVQLAGGFLQDYANVVKSAGDVLARNRPVWPLGALPAPADPTRNAAAEPGGWPNPPDTRWQIDVVSHIQALGVVANGTLEALQAGASGALQTTADLVQAVAKKTGELANTVVDSTTTLVKMLPWALGVAVIGGVIYFVSRIEPAAARP